MARTRGGSTRPPSNRRSKRVKRATNDVVQNQVDETAPSSPVVVSASSPVVVSASSPAATSSPAAASVHGVASSSVPNAFEETEMDIEDDTQPLQPERFFFSHKDFGKSCTFSTRCHIASTLDYLEEKLHKEELNWFLKHNQFKHLWHLVRRRSNKMQGLWMLIMRTAFTKKKKVCWFVVNGIPIRYSIREHALITGFNCREYGSNFNEASYGKFDFVERIFGCRNVNVSDVKAMLDSMNDQCGGDRLQVAVLLFLAEIIKGARKFDAIHPFVLRIVNDLKAVENFPWGRMTFEDNLTAINHTIKHFNGEVKSSFLFPGFIIPLEILAFECIHELSNQFQQEVRGAKHGCPLMCKRTFKENGMRGFPLEHINKALGTTTDIISILEPSETEQPLFLQITERIQEEDVSDSVVDAWNERLCEQQKKIWWKGLYKLDLDSRGYGDKNVHGVDPHGVEQVELNNVPRTEHVEEPQQRHSPSAENMSLMEVIVKTMEKEFNEIKTKLKGFEERLYKLERYVYNPRDEEPIYSPQRASEFENGQGACSDTVTKTVQSMAEPVDKTSIETMVENEKEPVVENVEEPMGDTTEQPVADNLVETGADNLEETETNNLENVEEPMGDTMEEPVDDIVEEHEVMDKTVEKTVAKNVEQPVVDNMEEPLAKNVQQPVVDVVEESMAIAKTVAEPVKHRRYKICSRKICRRESKRKITPAAATLSPFTQEKKKDKIKNIKTKK